MWVQQCQECRESFSTALEKCPHCGRPSLFPNVTHAAQPDERSELDRRYRDACASADARGCATVRQAFEREILDRARPVICIWFNELQRLAFSDSNIMATYYERIDAGVIVPKGDKWATLRETVESATFPGYKRQIHFGALSLDGSGVRNYGNCALQAKDEMILHRTTLFEDNNVVLTALYQSVAMREADNPPKGFRAVWEDRHKLCVAKLAGQLAIGQSSIDFQGLLLAQGANTSDDRFVEAHIFGSLTVRSLASVRITRRRNRPTRTEIKDVSRQLANHTVAIETIG
jgi:hypothetical protein